MNSFWSKHVHEVPFPCEAIQSAILYFSVLFFFELRDLNYYFSSPILGPVFHIGGDRIAWKLKRKATKLHNMADRASRTCLLQKVQLLRLQLKLATSVSTLLHVQQQQQQVQIHLQVELKLTFATAMTSATDITTMTATNKQQLHYNYSYS